MRREPRPVESARHGAIEDATRRTRLANERTYLAWWRTGLTAVAVGFGAGRLVPELSDGASWPFEAVGVAFALVGVAFVAFGYRRQKDVDEALARGEYASLPSPVPLAFAAAGVVLGLATIVLLLIDP
jgi:putative membrane protein